MQPLQRLDHAARDQEQHERQHNLGDQPEGAPTSRSTPPISPLNPATPLVCDPRHAGISPQTSVVVSERIVANARTRPSSGRSSSMGKVDPHRGHDTFEDSGRPDCQQEAARAGADSQHEAFGQQLTHQAGFRGAERLSCGQFAPAQGPADEQEVADVHARDEQHDADDDHQQRCAQADEAPPTRIWDSTYGFCHDRRQRFR